MKPKRSSRVRPAAVLLALSALLLLLVWRPPPTPTDSRRAADNAAAPTTGSSSQSTAAAAAAAAAAACRQQVAKAAETVLAICPGFPGFCPKLHEGLPRAADYLTRAGPSDADMARQKALVDEFVAGPGLQERVQQLRRLSDRRGILISAGKPHHVGNAAAILHALRRQYNCTLPVEIAFRGDAELDAATREAFSRAFQPVFFLDLDQARYPSHHSRDYTMDRYEPKVYALYHSRFQQVLMFDADNLPLRDPSHLFDSPHSLQHGVQMWLDFWSPALSAKVFVGHDSVYELLGINKRAYWDVLSAGQGWVHRTAESGQLVFDRVRHADVLEYLWFLTSFSNILYRHVLGDKDTFGFAFAMAGKLHEVHAVAVPPGVLLGDEGGHWRVHGMLQYDHTGTPAFLHRTTYKWNNVTELPPKIDAVSGPLPNRFIVTYLGNATVPLAHTIPHRAMQALAVNSLPTPAARYVAGASHSSAAEHTDGSSYASAGPPAGAMFAGCPLSVYLEHQQAMDLGLPVSRQPHLEAACSGVAAQLQRLARPHHSAGHQQLQQQGVSRAARALHVDLQGRADDAGGSGSAQSECGGAAAGKSYWESLDAATWLAACQHARSAAASAAAMLGVPDCQAVEWHVAKYVLHEYAEAVARRDGGWRVVADVDATQPLLALTAGAPSASLIHHAQAVTLPAARAWVQQHRRELAALFVAAD